MYKRFFEECEEVEIPDDLKNIFRFPSTYIEKNIYKDKKHNFDLERFSIRYFKVKSINSHHDLYYKRRFYMDCLNSFLLFYEDSPIAIIGFEINEKKVFIKQIQGIREFDRKTRKNNNFHIYFFYWQKILIKYVEIYSKFMKFEEIKILKSKNNPWLNWDKNYRKLLEQFKINYDGVASDLGYGGKLNIFRNYFYKKI